MFRVICIIFGSIWFEYVRYDLWKKGRWWNTNKQKCKLVERYIWKIYLDDERNNSLYIGLPQTENNVKNIENDDKPHYNNQIST